MKLMTIAEYAKSRNVSDKMIRKLINEGQLPAGRIGNKYLLNVDAVDACFSELTGEMKKPPVKVQRRKKNVIDIYTERRNRMMKEAIERRTADG